LFIWHRKTNFARYGADMTEQQTFALDTVDGLLGLLAENHRLYGGLDASVVSSRSTITLVCGWITLGAEAC
jgi:hypothetical protein